ncbi:hypothetical protein BJ165DRAFT_164577 [Panaeolus papilionaceus]|nr:hypothetical protein BJ165DRAFT_164577 [Panaeolus papilionaceus]
MNIEGFLLDPLLAGAPVPHTTKLIASSSAPASCGIDSLMLCAGTLRYCRLTPHAVSGTQNPACTIKKLKLSFKTEYGSVGSFTDLATPWKDLITRLGNSLQEVEISDRNTRHKPGNSTPHALQHSTLTIDYAELWPSGDDLSSLTRLESLTLLGNMSPEKFNINFPPGFARTLQSHKAVPSIQTIRLILSLPFWIGTCPMWYLTERWDTLGGYLTSLAPQLQTLNLRFQMGSCIVTGGKDEARTLEDMKKHFRDALSNIKTAFPSVTVKVVISGECDFVV